MQHFQEACDNKTRLPLVLFDQTGDDGETNKLDNLVRKIVICTLIKGSGQCGLRLLNQIDLYLMKINLIAVFLFDFIGLALRCLFVKLCSPAVIERQTSTPIQSLSTSNSAIEIDLNALTEQKLAAWFDHFLLHFTENIKSPSL